MAREIGLNWKFAVNFALTRKLIIFGLVLPLAAIIGFLLATPYDRNTHLLVGLVAGVLILPIMMKWYHPLLIFSWNAYVNVFFLPGKPELWMLFTAIGFGIVVLNSAVSRDKTMIHTPAITLPLLFLLTVVLLTAKLTGGIGIYALGGGQSGGAIGGRGYINIIAATMGYFVLTSRVIPFERLKNYVSLFLLSGITGLAGNLAYTLGPAFYFLFYLFPIDFAVTQAQADYSGGITRIGGLAAAGTAIYYFMLARLGIRRIFDVRQPWYLVGFLATVFISLLGGFRSLLIVFVIQFIIQFYLEGLVRSRLCAFLVVGGLAVGALAFPFIPKMPNSVQRCLAFIPGVPVNQAAKADAENSTRWRTEMWSLLLPQVPKYLLLGKGYSYDPAELYLEGQAHLRGLKPNYATSIVSGAYHNGPLSVILPFGIFGAIGFLWLLAAGWWVLYRNYRYGDPGMQLVNTFLFAFFVSSVILFFVVFGALNSQLYKFTGILGFSLAINRGVRKPVQEPVKQVAGLSLQPVSP